MLSCARHRRPLASFLSNALFVVFRNGAIDRGMEKEKDIPAFQWTPIESSGWGLECVGYGERVTRGGTLNYAPRQMKTLLNSILNPKP